MNIYHGEGFYEKENDGLREFCWTKKTFNIAFENPIKYGLKIEAFAPIKNSKIIISNNAHGFKEIIETLNSWHEYVVFVPRYITELKIEVTDIFQPENDERKLGICIRSINLLFNEEEYKEALLLKNKTENALLNKKEFEEGKTILKSYPVNLAIGTETRCNIAAQTPCAYCGYEWHKEDATKQEHVLISTKNKKNFGEFFSLANKVIDCSVGEPTLNPEFPELIKAFTDNKIFSFTTNGQLLSKKILICIALLMALVLIHIEGIETINTKKQLIILPPYVKKKKLLATFQLFMLLL